MDFCRNVTVPGDYHQQEQVLGASALTPIKSPIDDLFSAQNTEVDVSLEWLSVFVEDCLYSTGNCLPAATTDTVEKKSTTTPPKKLLQNKTQEIPTCLQKFGVPGKARSKRRRVMTSSSSKTRPTNNPLLTSWSYNYDQQSLHHFGSTDPPLLHQTHWLADSELINVPKKDHDEDHIKNTNTKKESSESSDDAALNGEEEVVMVRSNNEKERLCILEDYNSSSSSNGQLQQQARRCTHCLSQRTPQWRAGPLGPKTLCNACGVRYKSGRLLPEYRPAKSPTFVSYLHSNSHKKVMEMRNLANK